MIRMPLILITLAIPSTLFAQTEIPEASISIVPPPGRYYDQLKTYLGLTDFQLEQLIEILKNKTEAWQEAYKEVSQKEAELYRLLNTGSQDVNRIGQLTLEIHKLRTQPPPSNDVYRQRALAILAADQRNKLGTLEEALRLNSPAYQAVSLNLIDYPMVRILPVPADPRIMEPADTVVVPGMGVRLP